MRADSAQGRWKSFQMVWLAKLTASALGAGNTEQKIRERQWEKKTFHPARTKFNRKLRKDTKSYVLQTQCYKYFFFLSAWFRWSWVWSQCPIQVLIREKCVTRHFWTVTLQTYKKRQMLIRLSIVFAFLNCIKKFNTCSLRTPEGKKDRRSEERRQLW